MHLFRFFEANPLRNYLIVAKLIFVWISFCQASDPAKIINGTGKWSQDDDSVILTYTSADTKDPELFLSLRGCELHARINTVKEVIKLPGEVDWPLQWNIDHTSGTVKIKLKKKERGRWPTLSNAGNDDFVAKDFWEGRIKSTQKISEDSYLVRMQLTNQVFQHVPAGRHIAVRKREDAPYNETRAYTAVPMIDEYMRQDANTWRNTDEYTNFLIKRYEGRFMSPYVTDPVPSDGLGRVIYISNIGGPFQTSYLKNKKKVTLYAAGTGITPMISVVLWILKYQPETEVKLFYFNKSPKYVIWGEELEKLAKNHSRFKIEHIYTDKDWIRSANWKGLKGRVTREMIESQLPKQNKNEQLVCMCGMPPFTYLIEDVLVGVLGYEMYKTYFPFRGLRDTAIPKNLEEYKSLHPTK